jgi:hypothetical protein
MVSGPSWSYALTCPDEHGLLNGAVRFVAPDDSVLTEGECRHGLAIGAWFDWREGRLQRAVALGSGGMFGLSIFWGYDGNYYHRVERFPGNIYDENHSLEAVHTSATDRIAHRVSTYRFYAMRKDLCP